MIEVSKKLNVSDYVLEIDGMDIYNCTIKYSFTNIEKVYYKNDSVCEQDKSVINIEINGNDLDDNDAWIYFEIFISLNELREISNIPVNIIDKVYRGESFVKRPLKNDSECFDFEISLNNFDDIYRNLSSLWVSKLDNNNFVFKVCVPDEKIFSYFKIDFNENNED